MSLKRITPITFFIPTFLFTLFTLFTLSTQPVFAHCPLCTAATASAVAVTRWYGVDDMIVGTFIGAFVISTAFWTNRVLRKRNKGKDFMPSQLAILTILSLVLTIVTFYFAGLYGSFVVFGVDKIVWGLLAGSSITLVAYAMHEFLKSANHNRTYLPFQVIIITFVFLFMAIFAFYAIGLV